LKFSYLKAENEMDINEIVKWSISNGCLLGFGAGNKLLGVSPPSVSCLEDVKCNGMVFAGR
jgi:hypothetical protein